MEVKGRQVRLGINAPANTPIHREEVFVKIKEANQQAVNSSLSDLDRLELLLKS
jgi:carbon storage regulator